jgi:homoserine dehydrogenase
LARATRDRQGLIYFFEQMEQMKAIQVGVMGLGTVGGGVFEVLRRNQE